MRKSIFVLAIFAACLPVLAQSNTAPQIAFVVTAPSGACTPGEFDQQVFSTGLLYSCQSGAWTQLGGGSGSGSVTNQQQGYIPLNTNGTPTALNAVSPLYVANGGVTDTGPFYQATLLADGDSITCCIGNVSKVNSYPNWVARTFGFTLVNDSVPSQTSQSLDSVIFGAATLTGSKQAELYTIGTNNVGDDPAEGSGGTPNLEADYGLNITAQYAWRAIPPANVNAFATSPNVTYPTGTWTGSGLFGGADPGKGCSGTACSATITFTGPILYLVTGIAGSNAAAGTLTCNGTATGATLYFTGVGGTPIPGPKSTQTSLTRVAGLNSGSNSCTFQSTSSSGTAYLEWFAGIPGTGPFPNAPIFVPGGIPDRNPADSTTPNYRPYQVTAANQLIADGLTNVQPVAVTAGLIIPSQYADGTVHPNGAASYALAAPFVSAINTALGSAAVTPKFTQEPISNNALYGAESMGAGVYAFNNLTTATTGFNTCFGYDCGIDDTTGGSNTYFGAQVGEINQTGAGNAGFGLYSLLYNLGSFNACFGGGSCQNQSASNQNSAMGYDALQNAGAGSGNWAGGSQALYNYQGSYGTATGYKAGYTATTAAALTATGEFALQFLTTGNSDTADGADSLQNLTTGGSDTATGSASGGAMTTANFNTLNGASAGTLLTTGSSNYFGGYGAGSNNSFPMTTTSNSVLLGTSTYCSVDGLTNDIVLGYFASCSASNEAVVGNNSLLDVYDGSEGAVAAHHSRQYDSPVVTINTGSPNIFLGQGAQTVILGSNSTPTTSGVITAGEQITIQVKQPSTGGPYSWTWPAVFTDALPVTQVAGAWTTQTFTSMDGTTLVRSAATSQPKLFGAGFVEWFMPTGFSTTPGMTGLGNGITSATTATVSPAIANSTAPAVSGDNSGWTGLRVYYAARQPLLTFGVAYAASTDYSSNARIWLGFLGSGCATATMTGADAPASCTYAMIRYSTTASDTAYQCVTSNGTSQTVTSIGVAPVTTYVPMSVAINASTVTCTVNGTSVSNSTNLPASTTIMSPLFLNTITSGTAVNHIEMSGWYGVSQNGNY
jgi:hypothetical protein